MNDRTEKTHSAAPALIESHSPAAVRSRLLAGPQHSYLRDFVYGAIDGAVTTFAVVSGVGGAGLSSTVIVILGIANIVADGFSMAASNFLGTKAERQHRDRLRRIEEEHIDHYPEGEREEVRQIMESRGFTDEDLERAVEIITSDRQHWIETMLKDEYGVALTGPVPWKAGAATFVAFMVVGSLPLLPFLAGQVMEWNLPSPYLWSTLMTAVAFFGVGAAKSLFVDQAWHWSGLETLLVGGGAAVLAYVCGMALESLV